MTVYAKIKNNKLITAHNGYNGITGFASNVTAMAANGFIAYPDEDISGYYAGTHEIINGVLTDISTTTSYIDEQTAKQNLAYKNEYLKKCDAITSAMTRDELYKDAGIISASVLTSRKSTGAADLKAAYDEYFTNTGITPPSIGE